MKKIIIFTSILLLVGVGCAKTQKPNATAPVSQNNNQTVQTIPPAEEKIEKKTRPPEINISAEENTEFENVFKTKSEETGFKVYYPTFIPDGFKLDKDSLAVFDIGKTGKLITYNLSNTDASTSSLIYIQEQTEGMEFDPNVLKQEEAEYLKGYIKTIQNDVGSFYVLLFLKDEKTFMRIAVKTDYIDPDTLSKIAESMK